MERKRYTDEQFAYCLRQAKAGTPITEICHKWAQANRRSAPGPEFAGTGVAELRELLQFARSSHRYKSVK